MSVWVCVRVCACVCVSVPTCPKRQMFLAAVAPRMMSGMQRVKMAKMKSTNSVLADIRSRLQLTAVAFSAKAVTCQLVMRMLKAGGGDRGNRDEGGAGSRNTRSECEVIKGAKRMVRHLLFVVHSVVKKVMNDL